MLNLKHSNWLKIPKMQSLNIWSNIPSEVDKATSIVDANVHIEDNSDLMPNKELSILGFVHTVEYIQLRWLQIVLSPWT